MRLLTPVRQVLPPLKFIIGRGKPFNFLVTEKWRNYAEISKIQDTPLLLLSALQVGARRGQRSSCTATVRSPIRVLASQDEMLPPGQMRELYDIAQQAGATDVTWVDFPEAHHMGGSVLRHTPPARDHQLYSGSRTHWLLPPADAYEVSQAQYWPALIHFFRKHHPQEVFYGEDSEVSLRCLRSGGQWCPWSAVDGRSPLPAGLRGPRLCDGPASSSSHEAGVHAARGQSGWRQSSFQSRGPSVTSLSSGKARCMLTVTATVALWQVPCAAELTRSRPHRRSSRL